MQDTIQIEMEMLEKQAEWLKALAHTVRLCIARGLVGVGSCNVNKMKDCLGLPQSTVSQHLQVLRYAGIVKGEKDGTVVNYMIADDRVKELIKILDSK
ncbi:MAG: metalloregulator ArsR/SmtB family transcription factor [Tissierellia bacterium]|nr:metalloregulator ArsR/SmtB family transcription factor [Tissierellia bacterium]